MTRKSPPTNASHDDLRCPKCQGPAIRLTQTGTIDCARQCEESFVEKAKRIALEEWNARMARDLGAKVPADIGFVLITCNFGEGSMTYASNVERNGCVHMLTELVDKMKSEDR